MLEHYSHIRIDAKRQALEALDEVRRRDHTKAGDNGGDNAEVNAANRPNGRAAMPVILVFRDVTSQFTSQSVLAGSPPSAKLLIPLARRDVRVVEGARLEIEAAERA